MLRSATLVVVTVAWIFFRAQSMESALQCLGGFGRFQWSAQLRNISTFVVLLGLVVVFTDVLLERRDEQYPFQKQPIYGLAMGILMALLTVAFGATEANAFIYFQF